MDLIFKNIDGEEHKVNLNETKKRISRDIRLESIKNIKKRISLIGRLRVSAIGCEDDLLMYGFLLSLVFVLMHIPSFLYLLLQDFSSGLPDNYFYDGVSFVEVSFVAFKFLLCFLFYDLILSWVVTLGLYTIREQKIKAKIDDFFLSDEVSYKLNIIRCEKKIEYINDNFVNPIEAEIKELQRELKEDMVGMPKVLVEKNKQKTDILTEKLKNQNYIIVFLLDYIESNNIQLRKDKILTNHKRISDKLNKLDVEKEKYYDFNSIEKLIDDKMSLEVEAEDKKFFQDDYEIFNEVLQIEREKDFGSIIEKIKLYEKDKNVCNNAWQRKRSE